MGTTVRRIRRFVQKLAEKALMNTDETTLAEDCVLGISQTGSCKVSDIARTLPGTTPLRETVRPFYDGLSEPRSNLDGLRAAWLDAVSNVASNMPFIAVDPSDIIKLYGKKFDFLDVVSDRSDRDKRKGPGFFTIQIDALDYDHRNLPLWHEVFSTIHPDYRSWYDTIGRAMLNVLDYTGNNATWLFDRGMDAGDFYTILNGLPIKWVVRQLQTRNVIFGDDRTILMRSLAESIRKPHEVNVPYVSKSTHRLKQWPLRFGYVPVRLPGFKRRFFMIVVNGLRNEDMVLLTNDDIKTIRQAKRIVLAYMRRWGIEEGIRCWKQSTGVEDFRVRCWNSIRRLTFFSMLAYGIQALWLICRPTAANRLMERVKVFIEHVPFQLYRLWEGTKIALNKDS